MKRYGISAAAVFPFNTRSSLVDESLHLLKYKSGSIYPFLRFDPKRMTPKKVRKLLENDFSGVKLHPRAQNFNPIDKRYSEIFSEIESSGLALIIHTRKDQAPNADPDSIVKLADRFPRLNIIIGHFASGSRHAIGAISEHKNLYLETSVQSTNYAIGRVARRIGAGKILFGSDAPYSDQEIELMKVRKSGLSKSDQDKILFRNALKLLKA